jgi:hypothetical protein
VISFGLPVARTRGRGPATVLPVLQQSLFFNQKLKRVFLFRKDTGTVLKNGLVCGPRWKLFHSSVCRLMVSPVPLPLLFAVVFLSCFGFGLETGHQE